MEETFVLGVLVGIVIGEISSILGIKASMKRIEKIEEQIKKNQYKSSIKNIKEDDLNG